MSQASCGLLHNRVVFRSLQLLVAFEIQPSLPRSYRVWGMANPAPHPIPTTRRPCSSLAATCTRGLRLTLQAIMYGFAQPSDLDTSDALPLKFVMLLDFVPCRCNSKLCTKLHLPWHVSRLSFARALRSH